MFSHLLSLLSRDFVVDVSLDKDYGWVRAGWPAAAVKVSVPAGVWQGYMEKYM